MIRLLQRIWRTARQPRGAPGRTTALLILITAGGLLVLAVLLVVVPR